MKEEQFGKPVIAIVNSFTQFVPGHAHLHDIGQYIKGLIEKHGFFAAEFNTIAIDDGIAMGHRGMHYSLPTRGLIADMVESVAEARDVKGLYAKARAGIIPEFTGISDPYEEPERAEIVVDTSLSSIDASADLILGHLERLGYLS